MGKINLTYKKSFIVTSIFFFLQGFVFASWASRIVDIKAALGLSDGELGGLILAIPIGQLSAMAISAWAVGRFSSRRTARVATVALPLALLAIGQVDSVPTFVVSLFFFGMFMNLNNLSINTQGVDVEKVYNKNILPTFHGMWSLGGFSGALLCFMMSGFGVNISEHFIIVAVIAIVTGLVMSRYLLDHDSKPQKSEKKVGFLKRFDRTILLLGVISFCAMICEGTMFDWSGIYFKDVVGAPDSMVRIGYIVCMLSMTTGRFIASWFIGRFGSTMVVRCSGLLIAVGLLLSVAFPNVVMASLGFLIVGFGISSTVPVCYSIAGRSKTIPPSTALAAVSTIGCFGFLSGPPLIGFITEAITLRWTFAFVILLALCVSFLVGFVKTK